MGIKVDRRAFASMHKTYYKTPLGWAEITADESAVLSVRLVDKPGDVDAGDGRMSSSAGSAVLDQCVRELDEYFKGKRRNFDVKLARRCGTDFQRKVWNALEKIPYGAAVSYEDIARAIGRPRAVRAVGLANSKNPHWVVVPCHRVIGKNGALTGYAGGLDRKKWLLEHEAGGLV